MASDLQSNSVIDRPTWRELVASWREIGGLGQVALVGLTAAVALTIAMGFSITSAARGHLLDARADLIAAEVAELPPLTADDGPGSRAFAAHASAIQRQLLGGETERVKVWLPDGTILYSDDSTLIGDRFVLSEPAIEAFEGSTVANISDLQDDAHEADREFGELIEIYVPKLTEGEVLSVVEVEHRLTSLNEALAEIRGNVWFSISFGVGVLALFLLALSLSVTRGINQRREQAESLLTMSFDAQEEERRRTVGVLHDDLGQPLYRLLYGLEGGIGQLPADDPVADELGRLRGIVRQMDDTLRAQLSRMQGSVAEDTGLEAALRDLAAETVAETSLAVLVSFDAPEPVGAAAANALFRTAREAVVNARKHANASQIGIAVAQDDSGTTLVVSDDGLGGPIDPALGLTTCRDRIESLDGAFTIHSSLDNGSAIEAFVPAGTGPQ